MRAELPRLAGKRSWLDRFDHYVSRGDECWVWRGSINKTGYGLLNIKGDDGKWIPRLAHRLSWLRSVGAIPDGLFVCHHCDNPRCVRPDHLFLAAKGRARNNPALGSRHPLSKLTEDRVRVILTSDARGIDLAAEFGVTPTVISAVRKRKIWRHVCV